MIIGLGSDIVNIERVAQLLDKSGDKFKNRTFTKHEIEAVGRYSDNKKINAHFAKRFAAKEAFAKAVGTGFGKHLSFLDVGVENDEAGKPFLVLNDRASALARLLTDGKEAVCHLSLSDDYPYAVAVVIIEINHSKI
jgi:holo-[acyl-carrier protein] synthase